MLLFKTLRRQLKTGERVPIWTVRVVLSQVGRDESTAPEELLIDTGASYTTVPMGMAQDIGLSPPWIRRNCDSITLTVANGVRIIAHLLVVKLRVDDDHGHYAQWLGHVAFCDAVKRAHAGKSGFLHYLRFADQGPNFSLDPVSAFPETSTP